MMNFTKLKTFIFQCELETKTKTFKAIDFTVKIISMFDLHYKACNVSHIHLFFNIEKSENLSKKYFLYL